MADYITLKIVDKHKGCLVEVRAEYVDVGIEGMAVHETYGDRYFEDGEAWSVSEESTGTLVATGETREEATQNAIDLIARRGLLNVQEQILKMLDRPDYKKIKKRPVIKRRLSLNEWLTI